MVSLKFKSLIYNERGASKHLQVATVTMSCDLDPETNLTKIARLLDTIIQTHPGIELVIFGEMILGWYNPGDQAGYHRQISKSLTSESLRALMSLAAQHRVYLCFGLSEEHNQTLHNTQVLVDPHGVIQAIHRKWNLKPAERQADYQPGPVPVTVTEIKGIKVGITICSDAAHPRTMWELVKQRLDLIILSLADDRDEDLFMAKFNARLYDAWIVTANRYGQEADHFWNGHMVISDPLGKLRAIGQDQEQYLVADLRFANTRSRLKTAVRQAWVKFPLAIHVLRHWKIARSYF